MNYVKQTWATGDVVTAEKMNYIENGIAGAGGSLIVHLNDDILDKTWQEINNTMRSGIPCYIVSVWDDEEEGSLEVSWELIVYAYYSGQDTWIVTSLCYNGSSASKNKYFAESATDYPIAELN